MSIETRLAHAGRRPAPWGLGATLALLALLLAVRVVHLLTRDPAARATLVPDDQFYYLVLARNHAAHGIWSFDGGISVTNGFHPLLARLLSAAYGLAGPEADALVLTGATVLAALVSFLAVALAVRLAWRLYGTAALAVALALVPSAYWLSAAWVVEWPYAVLAAAVVWSGVAGVDRPGGDRAGALALVAAAAVLGSLARADFGGGPFCLAVAAFCVGRRDGDWRALRAALAALAGAALGLVLVFVHHVDAAGTAIPGSAAIKAHWASAAGWRPDLAARFVVQQFLPVPIARAGAAATAAGLAVLAGLAALAAGGGGARRALPRGPGGRTVFAAAWGTGVLYVVLYGLNAAVQPWYTASFALPALILGAALVALALDRLGRIGRAAAIAGGVMLALAGTGRLLEPAWAHQRYWFAMGERLRDGYADARVGAWNAGLVSFVSRRAIVNLDGVVNNDVHPAIRSGTLADYLDATAIGYLADYGAWVEEAWLRRRGGYDDPALLARLDPVLVEPGSEGTFAGSALTLWRVAPD